LWKLLTVKNILKKDFYYLNKIYGGYKGVKKPLKGFDGQNFKINDLLSS